jgi:hypothetical protein
MSQQRQSIGCDHCTNHKQLKSYLLHILISPFALTMRVKLRSPAPMSQQRQSIGCDHCTNHKQLKSYLLHILSPLLLLDCAF